MRRIAKQQGGPYNSDGVRVQIDKGESKNVYLKVRNNGTEAQVAELEQEMQTNGYRLRFYRGSQNITQAVDGDGYEFTAKAKTRSSG